MKDVVLTLPADALAGAKIPPAQLERELRCRLAAALFGDGILSNRDACKLAGLEKAEFQYWLGEHGITQPLGAGDFEKEQENLAAWRRGA